MCWKLFLPKLEQAAVVEPTKDDEDQTDEDSDELDFSML